MNSLHLILILGRRDEPTDAVEDYCRLLGGALGKRGIQLELLRVPWAERGWPGALRWLKQRTADWPGRWALVQYTALGWSRRGWPLGFVRLIRVLKRAGLKVAIVFHDAFAFPGSRLRDRLRRRVQLAVMRRSARVADKVVSAVSPQRVPWMGDRRVHSRTVLIPVGSNVPARWQGAPLARSETPVVVVFGVTEHNRAEAALIAQVARRVEQEHGALRLVVLGRGATLAEPTLCELLDGSGVELEVHGILPSEQVSEVLARGHAQLFVRDGISTRRGSAIAGIVCGLPIVGFADEETDFPITAAGVRLVARGDTEGLVRGLVAVLADEELREALSERSREAALKYFSWDAVADEYLRVLQ